MESEHETLEKLLEHPDVEVRAMAASLVGYLTFLEERKRKNDRLGNAKEGDEVTSPLEEKHKGSQ